MVRNTDSPVQVEETEAITKLPDEQVPVKVEEQPVVNTEKPTWEPGYYTGPYTPAQKA